MSNKKKAIATQSPAEFDFKRAQALGGSLVVTHDRYLSDEQIEVLKLEVNQRGEAALVTVPGNTTTTVDNYVRRSRTCFLRPEQFKWVYDILWNLAKKVNQHYQFDIKPISEMIQLAIYDDTEQGGFDWHTDATTLNMRRKISISIPLSGPAEYIGGELQFMTHREPVSVLQPKGCPITFPSIYMHRVSPVTKGRRYSLVAWIGGPSWR